MIDLLRVHSDLKLVFNKLNTNHKLDLPNSYIDDLINIVILDYVEIFATGNNSKMYKVGFEVTQQRIDMLSNLVMGQPEVPLITPKSSTLVDVYEFDLGELPKPYFHAVRLSADSDCGVVNIHLVQHDDLNVILQSATRGPSNIFMRAPAVIRKSSDSDESSVYVYTNGKFSLSEGLRIDYIRCPEKVYSGGYDTLEYIHNKKGYKKGDPIVNIDLNNKFYSIFLTMLEQELARVLEDPFKLQSSMQKFQTLA